MKCHDCPRNCGVDREKTVGFCKESHLIRIAKVIENFMWEEPCISGEKGSLAIFFSGCNLKCSFCQNKEISHSGKGRLFSIEEFADFLYSFDMSRYSTLELITPSHFSSVLCKVFEKFKSPIPVVWNSNAYEKEEIIDKISSFVDVFVPDLKFFNCDLAQNVALAKDYFEISTKAILKMRENKPANIFKNNVLHQGLLIRHLVLPNNVKDSIQILDFIKGNIKSPFVSIMSQFTPIGKHFNRKIFPLEYKAVLSHAEKIGLTKGYFQDIESANEKFIPDF